MTALDELLSVSVVVPCRDEIHHLPEVIAGLEAQTLAPVEVIVVDGRSGDGSREWLDRAARDRPWLRVIDNAERSIPAALNRGIEAARGQLIARMDTHARYDADYLRHVAEVFADHPDRSDDVDHAENAHRSDLVGVGGLMATAGRGPWGEAIAAVLRRPIGMGGAAHRVGAGGEPVDHVFSGCYRRQALLDAGGYDLGLLANEDVEMDVRLRRRGGTIWLDDRARSTWYGPSSIGALASKMARYGHFRAQTMRRHPRSVRWRHLAPPALVLVLTVLGIAAPRTGRRAAVAYLAGSAFAGARAASSDGASRWRAALVPAVIHLSWGAGLMSGGAVVLGRSVLGRSVLGRPVCGGAHRR